MSSGHSKVGWQKVATEAPVIGMTSSPAQISAHVWLSHLDRCQVPPAHRQAHRGGQGRPFQAPCVEPHHGGRDDPKGCNLNPKGVSPKAFRSNVHDA
jgi:hypothetical protein